MDAEKTLKILKMVQEGFLTPEQGQRLIQELVSSDEEPSGGTKPAFSAPDPSDVFRIVEDVGRTFTQGFETLFGFANQIKDDLGMAPKNVIVKVLDADGTLERYQVTIPYKIFTALKPLLLQKSPVVVHPLQSVDFEALFESLESGHTGRILEYVDRARGDRLEVWVQ